MISLLGFGVIGCSDSKEDTNEVVKKKQKKS